MALILDNGLDNALEAAAKLEAAAERWITVEIEQKQAFLHMIIRNPVAFLPEQQGEDLKTTKTDAYNHGLGLTNMRQLAKKHNGQLSYDCDGQIFTLRIMVNISNCGIQAAETVLVPKP